MKIALDTYMNHIDRMKEYCELEGEDYKGSQGSISNIGQVATKEWPMHGKIIISKLSIRYATDLPLILKNLSLTIDAGQSIGVCGRTGSGKSTLMLSLLRILTYEAGSILIDDNDHISEKVNSMILGGLINQRLGLAMSLLKGFTLTWL